MGDEENMTHREVYLRETGRANLLVTEGYVRFGIHQGGRDPYTPMAELNRLCREVPDRETPTDPLYREPAAREQSDVARRNAQVARLRASGMPTREIAADLGMTHTNVRKVVRTMGVKARILPIQLRPAPRRL